MDEDLGTPHQLLRFFRHLVVDADAQVGVTVLVSGAWVTGLLVDPRRYIETVIGHLREKSSPEASVGAAAIANALEQQIEWFAPPAAGPAEADEDSEDVAEFGPVIRLVNARVLLGGSWSNAEAALSIRADRIDAFMLGAFDVQ